MSVQPGFCPRWTGKRQVFSSEVSERIMQDFAQEKKLDATFIKDLIQKVLHHPDFDPDEVDHYMHERLMGAI